MNRLPSHLQETECGITGASAMVHAMDHYLRDKPSPNPSSMMRHKLCYVSLHSTLPIDLPQVAVHLSGPWMNRVAVWTKQKPDKLATFRTRVIKANNGVVATDDGRCSRIGRDVLIEGGHAVDAAVAAALCLGVVSPASSGIGGGAFMLVASADGEAQAFDMRETAPKQAS
ncbi:hypothetical protein T459_13899 [Capsicum annuum]|uniref:Uncharacterized protein n=1 Tax=Capsicum annuum TaxID=4072 RepID=A0A2G2ZG32_CAPAN|nr:hypothetical protein T459_13899 [Capsicum annuum]